MVELNLEPMVGDSDIQLRQVIRKQVSPSRTTRILSPVVVSNPKRRVVKNATSHK